MAHVSMHACYRRDASRPAQPPARATRAPSVGAYRTVTTRADHHLGAKHRFTMHKHVCIKPFVVALLVVRGDARLMRLQLHDALTVQDSAASFERHGQLMHGVHFQRAARGEESVQLGRQIFWILK